MSVRIPPAVTPANARIRDLFHRAGSTVVVACVVSLSLLADVCNPSSSPPLLMLLLPLTDPDCFDWQNDPDPERPSQFAEARALPLHRTELASSILTRHSCNDTIKRNRLESFELLEG
jgi:hypothetical protein